MISCRSAEDVSALAASAWVSSRFLGTRPSNVPLAGKRHQFGKALSRPVDPALDGANRTAESSGCLLIGQPVRPNEHDRLALARRQLTKGCLEILDHDPVLLVRDGDHRGGIGSVHILDLTDSLANPDGRDSTPYDRLVASFSNPFITAFYVLALILLGLHLRHGIWSATQTLGQSNRRRERTVNAFAIVFSTALIAGFLIVPFSVLFGLVD